jgi:hypothetical protein
MEEDAVGSEFQRIRVSQNRMSRKDKRKQLKVGATN